MRKSEYAVMAIAAALALSLPKISAAQELGPIPLQGQFRDAIRLEPSGEIILSVYDRNEVWRIDAEGLEIINRVAVGRGPSSLALSKDGSVIACVNRLDNTLTLVDEQGMALRATVKTGLGPHDVTALPGGGFAVSNQLDDSLTIVDAQKGEVSATIRNVASVPGPLAASNRFLAVATRVPEELLIFEPGGTSPARSIALNGTPTGIAAISEDRFVVSTRESIVSIDASTGAVISTSDIGANALALYGGRVAALGNSAIELLEIETLKVVDEYSFPRAGYAVAASGEWLAVLAPATRKAYVLRHPVKDIEAAAAKPAISPPPVTIDSRPNPELTRAAPDDEKETSQEETVEAANVDVLKQTEAPEIETLLGEIADTKLGAQEAEEATDQNISKRKKRKALRKQRKLERAERARYITERRPSRTSLGGSAPHAPALGAPSASPLDRPGRLTLNNELAQGFSFGATSDGFQIPDMSEGFLDVDASNVEIRQDGSLSAEGNVHIVHQDTELTADTLSFSVESGELEAVGGVLILQGASSIEADRLFFATEDPTEQEPRLAENGATPATPPGKGGRFVGENFHLIEPRREIHADYIEYDLSNQTGEVLHAHGRLGSIYFGAKTLEILGPEEAVGEDVWITTCDLPTPHYRIRLKKASAHEGSMVLGTNAQLQLGKVGTPLFVPKWRSGDGKERRQFTFDFDSGRQAEIGYFLNVGAWTPITPNTDLALRVMPTQKEGVGFGLDLTYDLMMKPASPFFRSAGSLNTMYTTQDRGYTQFYHRQELTPKTVLLGQAEQWYDEDFVKDFFYDTYRDRTGPRTFVNITRTAPGNIFSTTVAPSTHGFADETEKLPEVGFHLLEREVARNLYLTFDSTSGYYERSDGPLRSARTFNQLRLSYDINAGEGLNITPFIEADVTWYDKTLIDEDTDTRLSGTAGVTLQSRFHRNYKGALGFSAFRHIVQPSVTYFYRPDASLDGDDTPQFDGLDSAPGRSRIETKLENILLGRDAETGESWQVARATFYQGYDFQNETRKTRDYELEIDVRPRPWWGIQTVWENHGIEREKDLLRYFPTYDRLRDLRDRLFARLGREDLIEFREGDFSRILSFIYYDDAPIGGHFNGRLGFAFTETDSEVFNREILYGAGYRISDKWGVAFEHRYDIERGDLARQTYEVRRRLHCWDAALQFRDRDTGFDVSIEFSIVAFPGTKVKF